MFNLELLVNILCCITSSKAEKFSINLG